MIISLYWIGFLFFLTLMFPLTGITTLLSVLILGDRRGGHIHGVMGSSPLYITEVVLAALILRLLARLRTTAIKGAHPEFPWTGFYAVSAMSTVRGLLLYAPMQVIRDSALVYYSFFTHFFQSLISKDTAKLKIIGVCLAHIVLLKAVLTYTNWTFFYLEGSAVSMYFLCTIIISLLTFPQWSRCYWWYPAVTFLVYQVVVIVFRSGWIGLLLGLLFFMASAWRYRFPVRHWLTMGFLVSTGLVLGLAFPPQDRFQKPVGHVDLAQMTKDLHENVDHIEHSSYLHVSPLVSHVVPHPHPPAAVYPVKHTAPAVVIVPVQETPPAAEPKHNLVLSQVFSIGAGIQANNTSTRFWLAQDLLEELFGCRFAAYEKIRLSPESLSEEARLRISSQLNVPFILESERPRSWRKTLGWGNRDVRMLIGIPFGKTFLPPRLFYWMDKVGRYDPHDSFLSILYRTGIIGFLFFISILISEIRFTRHQIRQLSREHQLWLLAVWGSLLGFCGEAAFSVSLENPFKGVFFWILLGCIRALNRLRPQT